MKVAVGSTNPVKIEAVRLAFGKIFADRKLQVVGVDVGSGVSAQPMSDSESIRGARNRAKKAIKKLTASFGVGLEGGLQKIAGKWFDCGWIVVVDRKGDEGIGSTMKMPAPKKLMRLIQKGIELGEANDIIFGTKNSKQAQGHFGLMTKNNITRTSGYGDGVIAALTGFIHPKLF